MEEEKLKVRRNDIHSSSSTEKSKTDKNIQIVCWDGPEIAEGSHANGRFEHIPSFLKQKKCWEETEGRNKLQTENQGLQK